MCCRSFLRTVPPLHELCLPKGACQLRPPCSATVEKVDVDAVAEAARGLVLQARGNEIDTVVLACTHFPLLERELGEAFGPGVRFVHGAHGIARCVTDVLACCFLLPTRSILMGAVRM